MRGLDRQTKRHLERYLDPVAREPLPVSAPPAGRTGEIVVKAAGPRQAYKFRFVTWSLNVSGQLISAPGAGNFDCYNSRWESTNGTTFLEVGDLVSLHKEAGRWLVIDGMPRGFK